jgi:hypothetical protein
MSDDSHSLQRHEEVSGTASAEPPFFLVIALGEDCGQVTRILLHHGSRKAR